MARQDVNRTDGKRGSRIARETAACLLFFLALGACNEPMAAVSEIDKLRIMAVQTEPPEVGAGGSVVHRALYADPHGEGREVTVLWVTLFGEVSETSTGGGGGVVAPPGMTFGDEPYTVTVPEDILDHAPKDEIKPCRFKDEPPPGPNEEPPCKFVSVTTIAILCAGGVIDLERLEEAFAGEDLSALSKESDILCEGGDMITVFKQFRVSNQQDEKRNTNPTIDWMKLDGNPLNPVDEESAEEGGDVGVFTCTETDKCLEGAPIAALMTADSFQDYEILEYDKWKTVSDAPYISWFVTGGHFSNDRSRPAASDETFKVTWAPPLMGGTFTLWAVAHDLRGGVSWKRYTLQGITPD